MPLKIFHTADVHLGLKFGSYPEAVSKKLSDARFETLERMVQQANEVRCDLFIVSGDLFDNLRVSQRDIIRAAKILGRFDRLTLVLPGNHDYVTGQDDDIWKTFQSTQQDRVIVLTEKRAYSLSGFDIDACIYAAPCQNKHSKSHALGWIAETPRDSNAKFHLGVAHGSYEGLSCDTEGEYYPMKREDLTRCGLDLWLMGHIHVQYPINVGAADRIFYPSTPEPDGFDCDHEGKAWIIELDDQKSIQATSISTGRYRFSHANAPIQTMEDFDQLAEKYASDPGFKSTLIKLRFQGCLSREELQLFAGRIEELRGLFFDFYPDRSEVRLKLDVDAISGEFRQDSFGYRLLMELARDPADAEALQVAYELMLRSRETAEVQ